MSPEVPPKDRPLAFEDPALHPGWRLLEFLLALGADEFAVRFIHSGDEGKDACDRLVGKLAFATLGMQTRECMVTYAGESNPRPIEVWRFNPQSLEALHDVMPSGVLGSSEIRQAWAEDLCIYRRGALLFGTVTHEQFAFLRLSDAEWKRWDAQTTAGQRPI